MRNIKKSINDASAEKEEQVSKEEIGAPIAEKSNELNPTGEGKTSETSAG